MHRRLPLQRLMAALVFALPMLTRAGGIDHKVDSGDNTGIFSPTVQKTLQYGIPLLVVGSALWEGTDSRLGRTAWQSTDAPALGVITSESMKRIFSRSRPSQSDSPDDWFQGSGHQSFPSGEVMEMTTAVTPFILEYGSDHPAVWGLALIPVFDGVARVRSQAHWQTDVLASWIIGAGIGYYAHSRQTSLSVGILPGGFTVGWKTKF